MARCPLKVTKNIAQKTKLFDDIFDCRTLLALIKVTFEIKLSGRKLFYLGRIKSQYNLFLSSTVDFKKTLDTRMMDASSGDSLKLYFPDKIFTREKKNGELYMKRFYYQLKHELCIKIFLVM